MLAFSISEGYLKIAGSADICRTLGRLFDGIDIACNVASRKGPADNRTMGGCTR